MNNNLPVSGHGPWPVSEYPQLPAAPVRPGQRNYSATNILDLQSILQILQHWRWLVLGAIAAGEMLEAINKTGSVALYINFETGKSTIKPESEKIVDAIAEMLKANPALKISIEGHTDNVGTAPANLTLSENRAKAVLNALVPKGIDKARLSAKGWGQAKPIADNKTDDGKAKNRRVEIVKQ